MKKKIILSLLCGSLVLGLATGCGKKAKNNIDNNNSNIDNAQSSSNYKRDNNLPGTIEVNYSDIQYCFDSPSKQVYNRGQIFSKGHNDSYFVIYDNYKDPSSVLNYDVNLSEITKPSEVINGMKKQFINSISDYINRASDYKYTITNEKEVIINGYNMYRFEGELELLYEIENPNVDYTKVQFVGYSTIKDGIPMYFVVVQKPNENEQINLGAMADKIVKSLREYDGNCYDD